MFILFICLDHVYLNIFILFIVSFMFVVLLIYFAAGVFSLLQSAGVLGLSRSTKGVIASVVGAVVIGYKRANL